MELDDRCTCLDRHLRTHMCEAKWNSLAGQSAEASEPEFRIYTERLHEHVMDVKGHEDEIARLVVMHNLHAKEGLRWTLTRMTQITVYKDIALN